MLSMHQSSDLCQAAGATVQSESHYLFFFSRALPPVLAAHAAERLANQQIAIVQQEPLDATYDLRAAAAFFLRASKHKTLITRVLACLFGCYAISFYLF